MILKNDTPKGKFFTLRINGIPIKVWIESYGQYDLTKVDSRFATADELNEYSSRKNKDYGVVFNAHEFSLLSNAEKGKSYVNFLPSDVISVQSGGDEPVVIVTSVLIGTRSGGIAMFSGTSAMTVYNIDSGLSSNLITVFYRNSDTEWMFGTSNTGFTVVDSASTMTVYNESNSDLPNDTINALQKM